MQFFKVAITYLFRLGMVVWKHSYAKLRNWLSVLRSASRSDLLLQDGLGPAKVDKILKAREQAEAKGRSLSLGDLIGIRGAGKTLFSDDASAADVAKFVTCYEERFAKGQNLYYPKSVLSIDLGKVNAAYVLIQQHYRVQEWSMLQLGLPTPYMPRNCYENVKQSVEALPTADVYVIEEQSHRYRSNQGFLAVSIELRCLEAMVYATLRQIRGDTVHSIPPQRVSSYFNIGKRSSSSKKTEAVKLVRDLVEKKQVTPLGSEVLVSEKLAEFFCSRKKKDDLSDCLLQALAVLEWGNMSQQFRKH